MSGDFRPEQQVGGIESTDDPALAQRFGLTDFNRETGLYTAPKTPDAGQRDGEDVQEQRRRDALADGDAQNDAEREKLEAAIAKQQAEGGATKSSSEAAPKKATGTKASQSKGTDDSKGDDGK